MCPPFLAPSPGSLREPPSPRRGEERQPARLVPRPNGERIGSPGEAKPNRRANLVRGHLIPHSSSSPRCPLALAIANCGKTGGRKLAHLKFMCDLAAARPARTDLGPSIPIASDLPAFAGGFRMPAHAYRTVFSLGRLHGGPAEAGSPRDGEVRTPDGPTGTPRPVSRFAGYAGPSPHSRRRDKRSRRRD